jgi:hypothetical protein
MNKNSRRNPARARQVLQVIALSLGLLGAHVSRAGAPDLSGLWHVESYQPEIKTLERETPPLLPGAAEIYRRNSVAFRMGDLGYDAPAQACLHPGLLRLMRLPYPIQIIQRPHQLTMLYQWNNRARMVDLSGRPPVVDYPGYIGVAVGRWEADTLVVETTGLIETTFLDDAGMPHSEELHVIERYRLRDKGRTLTSEITIEDPKTFAHPWRTTVVYRKLPAHAEIIEDVCRDRVAAGGHAFDIARWK